MHIPQPAVAFRTRYKLQVIDKNTMQPTSDPVDVCNMVLDSGYLAMGDAVTYSTVSIGTNNLPTSPNQTSILSPASTLPIGSGDFSQTNQITETEVGSPFVTSTITRKYLFKDFVFPANLRTLDLCEIGLDGVTRAVFDTLSITQNNWVEVQVIIEYNYSGWTNDSNEEFGGQYDRRNLDVTISPFIYNQNPSNSEGKGYGTPSHVLCYVVDGDLSKPSPYDDKKYGATIGVTINRELQKNEYRWVFTIDKKATESDIVIPALVIRDTLNGVGYFIFLGERIVAEEVSNDGWSIIEDDHLVASFIFTWRPSTGPVAVDPGLN